MKSIIGLGIVCVMLTGMVMTDGGPGLQFAVSAGGEQMVEIEVWVINAPEIYGADIRLNFDPKKLEVIDADTTTAGVQLEPGDFIDPSKGFVIQHNIDNVKGSIDYALSLLNPAPPVQGDGVLARITFAAKSEGSTTITIEEGAFGSREGEAQSPKLSSAALEITRGENGDLVIQAADQDSTPRARPPILLWRVLGIVLLGLAGALFIGYIRYLRRTDKDI